jgi:hypothetical protein
MSRLVFVHGPWQLLVAASALKQASESSGDGARDTLVIYSLHSATVPGPIREVMCRMAPALGPWRRVIVLDPSIEWDLRDVRPSIEALRARLDVDEPDEVWLTSLWVGAEKGAAETYPGARIVLYEDGLHSYIEAEDYHVSAARCLREPRETYRSVRLRLRERMRPDDLSLSPMLPRHLARVSASYLWISLMLPPPAYQRRLPWVQIQPRFLREAIEQASPLADEVVLDGRSGPTAVVLGQCFSNYGDLARDVELDLYIEMAGRLQEMGYEVLWKEHPRTRRPFLPDLIEAGIGVHGLPDLGPWPIEIFTGRLGLAACASLISTSLFNLPLLFGLPTFSTVGRHLSSFRFPNDVMAQLVAKSIPQIDGGGTRPTSRPVVSTVSSEVKPP